MRGADTAADARPATGGRAPHQLPRGRHGLTRERVVQHQRERMLRGLAEAVAEKGYGATSVADITNRAGTSRETFYQQFSSKQGCFIAAYEAAASKILKRLREASQPTGTPLERFSHAITAYLDALAAEPSFARLFLVEVYAAGPDALQNRAHLQQRFAELLAEGLRAKGPTERFACDILVAGISAMVTARLALRDIDGIRDLAAPLTDLVGQALSAARGSTR